MPRGKRNENKAAEAPVDKLKKKGPEVIPAAGHNSGELTEDQTKKLFFTHLRPIKAKKEAIKKLVGELGNLFKVAKTDGFAKKKIEFALACENDDDDSMLQEHKWRIEIASWMMHPIGTQMEMFDGVDRRPAVDRAKAEGKKAGLSGDSRQPPYDPSVPQHQAWLEGWHEGQEVKIEKGIKPLEPIGTAESTSKVLHS